MSGTVLKHKEKGDEVFVIIATAGSALGDPKQRLIDSEMCAKELCVDDLFFLGMKDTEIEDSHETITILESYIKKIKPDRIYTHSNKDTHQDHRNLGLSVLTAARHVKQLFFFESPSSQLGFIPNYYVDISKYIDLKIKVLKTFKGGVEGKWYMEVDAVQGTSLFRGYQSKVKHAEAFETFRHVE